MKPAAADAAAKCQGKPHAQAGQRHGFPQLAARLPLRAVTDAELDRKIGSQPHTENSEGERDRVEGSHDQQSDRRGDRKAGAQRQRHSQHDLERAQSQPQDQEDKRSGDDSVQQCALLKGRKFLVDDWNGTGQSEPSSKIGFELRSLAGFADGRSRLPAGLQ